VTASHHLGERLDEWIDGRLSPAEEHTVTQHLDECESCRAEAAALRALRGVLADRSEDIELPVGLEARVRARLDAEDAGEAEPQSARPAPATAAAPSSTDRRVIPLWALPLAAALLLGTLALWWMSRDSTSAVGPVDLAFTRFAELVGADPGWHAIEVGNASELEQRWHEAALGFRTRVLDLTMSGYRLAGGDATSLGDGLPAALAVYQGPDGVVTCWMLDGSSLSDEDLPEPVDLHEANGFQFRVYQREGVTLVVWREGDVLCALAGAMGRDAVVALAHEKAMAPPLA